MFVSLGCSFQLYKLCRPMMSLPGSKMVTVFQIFNLTSKRRKKVPFRSSCTPEKEPLFQQKPQNIPPYFLLDYLPISKKISLAKGVRSVESLKPMTFHPWSWVSCQFKSHASKRGGSCLKEKLLRRKKHTIKRCQTVKTANVSYWYFQSLKYELYHQKNEDSLYGFYLSGNLQKRPASGLWSNKGSQTQSKINTLKSTN